MAVISKNKRFFILLIFLGIFGIVSGILASELDWPDSPGGIVLDPDGSKTGNPSGLSQMVQYFYEWGIAVGGLAAFIALVAAGFEYLTSAGDPTKMGEARSKIGSALLGLVLLLSSWLILNTINPELTTFPSQTFTLEDILDIANEMDMDPTEMEYCSWAVVYDQINFAGNSQTIFPSDTDTEFLAKSVKTFRDTREGTVECGPGACGCILQLAAGGWFLGWGCSDPIGYVPAYERDLTRRAEGYTIECVRLLIPSTDL